MNGQPSEAQPGPKAYATPGWQLAVVAVVLAALALSVFLPVGVVSSFFAGLLALVWGGVMLERVGALEPVLFREAMSLAIRLLLLVGGFALVTGLKRWFRALTASGSGEPPAETPWLLRWPWFAFGAVLMLLDAKLIPSTGGRTSVPGIAGAIVLTTTGWVALTVPYLLFRLGRAVLGLAWRLSRASPFGAGLVTLGGVGCVATVLALGTVAGMLSEASTTASSSPSPTCRVGERRIDCVRRFLVELNPRSGATWEEAFAAPSRRSGSTAGSTVFASGSALSGSLSGSTGGGPPSSFEQCLEAYEANPPLKSQALAVAGSIVGPADAQDVVGETLIAVCLHPRGVDSFEPFFIRSVRNRALNWIRKPDNGRRCSLGALPEPTCHVSPYDEFVRAETREMVEAVLCTLPDDDRTVLTWRYLDFVDDAEIAQRLGISHAAARKRLERARRKFQAAFDLKCQ